MSVAFTTFENAIRDAEVLLAHFDSLNDHPPPEQAEVFKRAGLILALTAWETYVEDCAREKLADLLQCVDGHPLTSLVQGRLETDLKRFHNPNSDRTMRLFREYLQVDLEAHWKWPNFDPDRVKATLDDLIIKRGEAVHRSKPLATGVPAPHLVKRDDLEKAIRFVKQLVAATERAVFAE